MLEDYRAQIGYSITTLCVAGGPESDFESPDEDGKNRSDDNVEGCEFVCEQAPGLAHDESYHY